eukprot:TRINITY_DN12688_c0_g2_i1.p2 TRINITY_DN12688_c0_g2~~TRINITY_DN12688_c0_g2_i1.p2  ORF type:complete len:167 (+),score=15.22 TRINITY_DN12688_c0_g2_i1:185-685(+)
MIPDSQAGEYQVVPAAQQEKDVVNVAVLLTIYFIAAISVLLTLYYCVRAARSATLSEEEKKEAKLVKQLRKLNTNNPTSQLTAAFDDCPICLERLQNRCKKCTLPCGHAYHLNCILNWVQKSSKDGFSSCPVCKTSLEPLAQICDHDNNDDRDNVDWSQFHIFYFV